MDALKVGRIVHYVAYGTPGGEFPKICRAAVVTEVTKSTEAHIRQRASLCVLNPSGQFFNQNLPEEPVQEGLELQGGTWHDPRTCKN